MTIKDFLINYSFYVCFCLLVSIIILIALNFRSFYKIYGKIKKITWVGLLFILLAGGYLRFSLVPHTSSVYYDEFGHISIAENFLSTKFFLCEAYQNTECVNYSLPPWLPGYHFLLAAVYFFSPENGPATAYNFNAFIGCFSILIVFLLAYLVSHKESLAIFASAILCLSPLHLKFSGSASLEIASFCFLSLSLLALFTFFETKSEKSYLLFIAVTMYCLLLRPENGLIIISAAVYFLIDRKLPKLLNRRKLILLLPLSLPIFFYHPFIRAQHEIDYLFYINDFSYFRTIFNDWLALGSNFFIPISFILLAGIGIYYSFKSNWKITVWLLVFFFSFPVFYTLVHKLDLSYRLSDNHRFIMQYYLPLIMFSAAGLQFIYEKLKIRNRLPNFYFSLIIIVVLINTFLCYPYLFMQLPPSGVRSLHNLELSINDKIDDNCIFVSYVPYYIMVALNRPGIEPKYVFDQEWQNEKLKNTCLVLEKGWFCREEPDNYCRLIIQSFDLEEIAVTPNGEYGLYYLKEKTTEIPPQLSGVKSM